MVKYKITTAKTWHGRGFYEVEAASVQEALAKFEAGEAKHYDDKMDGSIDDNEEVLTVDEVE